MSVFTFHLSKDMPLSNGKEQYSQWRGPDAVACRAGLWLETNARAGSLGSQFANCLEYLFVWFRTPNASTRSELSTSDGISSQTLFPCKVWKVEVAISLHVMNIPDPQFFQGCNHGKFVVHHSERDCRF